MSKASKISSTNETRRKSLLPATAVAVALSLVALLAPTRADAVGGGPDFAVTKFAIESGLLNVIFSKELCSCHFVDEQTVEDCMQTANLPSDALRVVSFDVDEQQKTVSARFKLTANFVTPNPGPRAAAAFDPARPELGCVATAGPGVD